MIDRGKCIRILSNTHDLLFDVEEVINKYNDVVCGEAEEPEEMSIWDEESRMNSERFDNPEKWFMGEMKRIHERKQEYDRIGSYSDAIDMALNLTGDESVHDTITRITIYAKKLWRAFPDECRYRDNATEITRFLSDIGNERYHYLMYQNNVTEKKSTTDEALNIPPRESNKNKTKGRPTRDLKSCMLCDNPEAMLSKLHNMIDGKQGKDVALIIKACIRAGVMTRPTFSQVQEEFGDIGCRQGYTNYMNDKLTFPLEEVNTIVRLIRGQ